jgi:hypothetical protein
MAKQSKKGVTVADLRDNYDGHVFLFCECCGGEYSATRGDYWQKPVTEVFACCDEPMRLVRKVTTLVDVVAP